MEVLRRVAVNSLPVSQEATDEDLQTFQNILYTTACVFLLAFLCILTMHKKKSASQRKVTKHSASLLPTHTTTTSNLGSLLPQALLTGPSSPPRGPGLLVLNHATPPPSNPRGLRSSPRTPAAAVNGGGATPALVLVPLLALVPPPTAMSAVGRAVQRLRQSPRRPPSNTANAGTASSPRATALLSPTLGRMTIMDMVRVVSASVLPFFFCVKLGKFICA
jgi:hypothetical protein